MQKIELKLLAPWAPLGPGSWQHGAKRAENTYVKLSPDTTNNPLFYLLVEAYDELGANQFVRMMRTMVVDVLHYKDDERSPLKLSFSSEILERVLAKERELVLSEYEDVQDCDFYIDFLSSDHSSRFYVSADEGGDISEMTIYCDRRTVSVGRTSCDDRGPKVERLNSSHWLTFELPQDVDLEVLESKLKGEWAPILQVVYDGHETVGDYASFEDEAILALRVLQKAIVFSADLRDEYKSF